MTHVFENHIIGYVTARMNGASHEQAVVAANAPVDEQGAADHVQSHLSSKVASMLLRDSESIDAGCPDYIADLFINTVLSLSDHLTDGPASYRKVLGFRSKRDAVLFGKQLRAVFEMAGATVLEVLEETDDADLADEFSDNAADVDAGVCNSAEVDLNECMRELSESHERLKVCLAALQAGC